MTDSGADIPEEIDGIEGFFIPIGCLNLALLEKLQQIHTLVYLTINGFTSQAIKEIKHSLVDSKTVFVFESGNYNTFDYLEGIRYNGWAGKSFDILGNGTINSVSIYNINEIDTTIYFGVFAKTGALFDLDPIYPQQQIDLIPGWNTVPVSGWDVSNSFIIAHEVNNGFGAAYDGSSSYNRSFLRFGEGAWDLLAYYGIDEDGDGVNDTEFTGEFGIRANITYEGLGVTYNVYRDDASIASGFAENTYTDSLVENNVTYEYAVSAIYPDGEESEKSSPITATPISDTVHELFWDDGTADVEFYVSNADTAASGNYSAVKYTVSDSEEDIARFKWYQHGSGGALYIKIFEDDAGNPGSEIYSTLQASGNQDGWNDKDLTKHGNIDTTITASGDFWVGVKEFTSSKPFGLDNTSNVGHSYKRIGSDGDWVQVEGNLMYRVYLDSGGNTGRVISGWGNEEEVSGEKSPIYTLKWENKKLYRVPLQINGSQVFRSEKQSPFLNRSNVLQDEIIPLMVFDFEDDELTELWTSDVGWNLTGPSVPESIGAVIRKVAKATGSVSCTCLCTPSITSNTGLPSLVLYSSGCVSNETKVKRSAVIVRPWRLVARDPFLNSSRWPVRDSTSARKPLNLWSMLSRTNWRSFLFKGGSRQTHQSWVI